MPSGRARVNAHRLNAICRAFMNEHGAPGLALAVANRRRPLHLAGLGVRNNEESGRVTPHSLFHMASITKTLTAATIFRLVERKHLWFDDTLGDLMPELETADDRFADITLKNLLTHTAGIPDNADLEWDNPQWDDDALMRHVENIAQRELKWKPGKHFEYTDAAYEVLGRVIERVMKTTYEVAIETTILQPLGMKGSTLFFDAVEERHLATPHVFGDDESVYASGLYPYNRRHAPSSTLHASARDMAEWMIALLNGGAGRRGRVLTKKSIAAMWTETNSTRGEFWQGVGMGFFLGEHRGFRFAGHEGSDRGFRASLLVLPEADIGVTVLVNLDGDHVKPLMLELLDELLGYSSRNGR